MKNTESIPVHSVKHVLKNASREIRDILEGINYSEDADMFEINEHIEMVIKNTREKIGEEIRIDQLMN